MIALLVTSGTARSNYSGPAYAVLLAAGAASRSRRTARRGLRRIVPALTGALILGVGVGIAPLAIPLLPALDLVRYSAAIGVAPPEDERDASGELPLHFALRFGWQELAQAVKVAADTLSPGERLHAVVLAPDFGAAGALNFQRRAYGLPPAVSGHNNYWLWGPGDTDGEVILAVAEDPRELERAYRSVEAVADVDCDLCRPMVTRYRVYVCRGLRRPLAELWEGLKRFV